MGRRGAAGGVIQSILSNEPDADCLKVDSRAEFAHAEDWRPFTLHSGVHGSDFRLITLGQFRILRTGDRHRYGIDPADGAQFLIGAGAMELSHAPAVVLDA